MESLLSHKYSEDDGDSTQEARTTYCSARCTKGCKNCLCVKAGFACDPEKCKCTTCENLTAPKDKKDPLDSWTAETVRGKKAKLDKTKSGPKGIPDAHEATVNDIVDLLWPQRIWDHISHESCAYLTYCLEFSKEIVINRKDRRRIDQMNKRVVIAGAKKKRKKTVPLLLVVAPQSSTSAAAPSTTVNPPTNTATSSTQSIDSVTPDNSQSASQRRSSEVDHDLGDKESSDSESDEEEEKTAANTNTQATSTDNSGSQQHSEPKDGMTSIPSFKEWFVKRENEDFSKVNSATTVNDLKKYFSVSVVMGLNRIETTGKVIPPLQVCLAIELSSRCSLLINSDISTDLSTMIQTG